MTIEDLRARCEEAKAIGLRISIVLPRRAGLGERMRLLGRKGPLGDIMGENSDGNTVCSFDPNEILRWLEKE